MLAMLVLITPAWTDIQHDRGKQWGGKGCSPEPLRSSGLRWKGQPPGASGGGPLLEHR